MGVAQTHATIKSVQMDLTDIRPPAMPIHGQAPSQQHRCLRLEGCSLKACMSMCASPVAANVNVLHEVPVRSWSGVGWGRHQLLPLTQQYAGQNWPMPGVLDILRCV